MKTQFVLVLNDPSGEGILAIGTLPQVKRKLETYRKQNHYYLIGEWTEGLDMFGNTALTMFLCEWDVEVDEIFEQDYILATIYKVET